MIYSLKPLAKKDLFNIFDFGLERWGETRAKNYIDDLHDFLGLIASQPDMGRERDDLGQGVRMMLFDPYLIFYQRSENEISVVRIVHSATDIGQIIFEL